MSGFSRLGWEYSNAEGQSVTVDLEKREGHIHCSVQGQSIELPIEQVPQFQQALAQMTGSVTGVTTGVTTGVAVPIAPQPASPASALPAVQPKPTPEREIDPNFPAKIRNGLLVMVGLVVVILAWDILANNRL